MIQADKGLADRLTLDPHEGRSQLERIRGPQRVPQEDTRGVVPDSLTGENLRPSRGEAHQEGTCLLFVTCVEEAFPPEPCEGLPTLDHAAPPHDHECIVPQKLE